MSENNPFRNEQNKADRPPRPEFASFRPDTLEELTNHRRKYYIDRLIEPILSPDYPVARIIDDNLESKNPEYDEYIKRIASIMDQSDMPAETSVEAARYGMHFARRIVQAATNSEPEVPRVAIMLEHYDREIALGSLVARVWEYFQKNDALFDLVDRFVTKIDAKSAVGHITTVSAGAALISMEEGERMRAIEAEIPSIDQIPDTIPDGLLPPRDVD